MAPCCYAFTRHAFHATLRFSLILPTPPPALLIDYFRLAADAFPAAAADADFRVTTRTHTVTPRFSMPY